MNQYRVTVIRYLKRNGYADLLRDQPVGVALLRKTYQFEGDEDGVRYAAKAKALSDPTWGIFEEFLSGPEVEKIERVDVGQAVAAKIAQSKK